MRLSIRLGCLLLAMTYVHSLGVMGTPALIQKRAAFALQVRGPPDSSHNNSQHFQWTKVNNQWVRKDGVALPGYSPSNVPYNQTPKTSNTPALNQYPDQAQPSNTNLPTASSGAPKTLPSHIPNPTSAGTTNAANPNLRPSETKPQFPAQNRTLNWDPSADRALTRDIPHTSPRPVIQTVPPTVATTSKPPPAPTPAVNAPFGSGSNSNVKPPSNRNTLNPDARLTYDNIGYNKAPQPSGKINSHSSTVRPGANPWAGL